VQALFSGGGVCVHVLEVSVDEERSMSAQHCSQHQPIQQVKVQVHHPPAWGYTTWRTETGGDDNVQTVCKGKGKGCLSSLIFMSMFIQLLPSPHQGCTKSFKKLLILLGICTRYLLLFVARGNVASKALLAQGFRKRSVPGI
jgi:hypothetical protein